MTIFEEWKNRVEEKEKAEKERIEKILSLLERKCKDNLLEALSRMPQDSPTYKITLKCDVDVTVAEVDKWLTSEEYGGFPPHLIKSCMVLTYADLQATAPVNIELEITNPFSKKQASVHRGLPSES